MIGKFKNFYSYNDIKKNKKLYIIKKLKSNLRKL